jgi:hypothetical protein
LRETKRGMEEEFVTKFVVRAMAPAGSAARLGVVKVHTFFLLGDGTYFFFVSDGLQVARLLCGGGVRDRALN